jgi:hypothetical protein
MSTTSTTSPTQAPPLRWHRFERHIARYGGCLYVVEAFTELAAFGGMTTFDITITGRRPRGAPR